MRNILLFLLAIGLALVSLDSVNSVSAQCNIQQNNNSSSQASAAAQANTNAVIGALLAQNQPRQAPQGGASASAQANSGGFAPQPNFAFAPPQQRQIVTQLPQQPQQYTIVVPQQASPVYATPAPQQTYAIVTAPAQSHAYTMVDNTVGFAQPQGASASSSASSGGATAQSGVNAVNPQALTLLANALQAQNVNASSSASTQATPACNTGRRGFGILPKTVSRSKSVTRTR